MTCEGGRRRLKSARRRWPEPEQRVRGRRQALPIALGRGRARPAPLWYIVHKRRAAQSSLPAARQPATTRGARALMCEGRCRASGLSWGWGRRRRCLSRRGAASGRRPSVCKEQHLIAARGGGGGAALEYGPGHSARPRADSSRASRVEMVTCAPPRRVRQYHTSHQCRMTERSLNGGGSGLLAGDPSHRRWLESVAEWLKSPLV